MKRCNSAVKFKVCIQFPSLRAAVCAAKQSRKPINTGLPRFARNDGDGAEQIRNIFKELIKSAALAAAAVLLFASLLPGAASALTGFREISVDYQNLIIEINGRTIVPKDAAGNTVYPFVYEDRTYLPVRALVNALGCGVKWDDAAKTVIISSSGSPILTFGIPVKKGTVERINAEYANIAVTLDGRRLTIKNEPFLYNGSVYLPVREISDSLNCKVDYVAATNVIKITYDAKKQSSDSTAAPATTAKPPAQPEPQKPSAQGTQGAPGTQPAAPNGAGKPGGADNSGGNAADKTQTSGASPGKSGPEKSGASSGSINSGSSSTPESSGSFSGSDLAFIISGKTVKLDQNISIIKDLLGAPKEYDEVESCAYTGLDKFYVYKEIEVSTLPIDGDLICAIDALKNTVKTEKGVTIGSPLRQIEAAYGKDYTLENGVLIYWAGPKGNPKTPQLYFMLDRGDNVESFGMYNGKSAG